MLIIVRNIAGLKTFVTAGRQVFLDFKITSIGILTNIEIVKSACTIINERLEQLKKNILNPDFFVKMLQSYSNSTIKNCNHIFIYMKENFYLKDLMKLSFILL